MTITDREVIEEFREQQKLARTGGRMVGGGPGASDLDSAGGSSGTGGYGDVLNQSQNDGPDALTARGDPDGLSRGERFDLQQGGGRSSDELDSTNELQEDQEEGGERP